MINPEDIVREDRALVGVKALAGEIDQPVPFTVTAQDVIAEARLLIGVKPKFGGTDPLTGVDHIGFALVVANRLGLLSSDVLQRYTRDHKTDRAGIRVCIELRRFVEELPENEAPQIGDAAMFLMLDSQGEVAGETPAVITCLDPATLIYLTPEGLIERKMAFCWPTRIFRLRNREAERPDEQELIIRTAFWIAELGRKCIAEQSPLTLLEFGFDTKKKTVSNKLNGRERAVLESEKRRRRSNKHVGKLNRNR